MDRLANLRQAGRADHPRVGMEFEARRVPIETDEVDQEPGVTFQVGDHLFVAKLEKGRGLTCSQWARIR